MRRGGGNAWISGAETASSDFPDPLSLVFFLRFPHIPFYDFPCFLCVFSLLFQGF